MGRLAMGALAMGGRPVEAVAALLVVGWLAYGALAMGARPVEAPLVRWLAQGAMSATLVGCQY